MNPISLSEISRSVGELFGLSGTVSFAAVAGVLLLWICWRTRSIHFITSWIWRIFAGKDDMKDADLGHFLETRLKLLKFRFYSGIPARTWAQAKKIIAWGIENDEELVSVAICGSIFDKETCTLKGNRKSWLWQMAGVMILVIALIATTAVLFAIHSSDRALLKMNDSGTWISASTEKIKVIFSKETMAAQDCSSDNKKLAGRMLMTLPEISAVCAAFADKSFEKFIQNSVHEQREISSRLAVFLSVLIAFLILAIRQLGNALDMDQRLKKRTTALERSATQDKKRPIASEKPSTVGATEG